MRAGVVFFIDYRHYRQMDYKIIAVIIVAALVLNYIYSDLVSLRKEVGTLETIVSRVVVERGAGPTAQVPPSSQHTIIEQPGRYEVQHTDHPNYSTPQNHGQTTTATHRGQYQSDENRYDPRHNPQYDDVPYDDLYDNAYHETDQLRGGVTSSGIAARQTAIEEEAEPSFEISHAKVWPNAHRSKRDDEQKNSSRTIKPTKKIGKSMRVDTGETASKHLLSVEEDEDDDDSIASWDAEHGRGVGSSSGNSSNSPNSIESYRATGVLTRKHGKQHRRIHIETDGSEELNNEGDEDCAASETSSQHAKRREKNMRDTVQEQEEICLDLTDITNAMPRMRIQNKEPSSSPSAKNKKRGKAYDEIHIAATDVSERVLSELNKVMHRKVEVVMMSSSDENAPNSDASSVKIRRNRNKKAAKVRINTAVA
jgi:hypothetical protein